MSEEICSVRMHASLNGGHLSGGEQLVSFEQLQHQTLMLLERAFAHERGAADSVSITIDPVLDTDLLYGSLPRVETRTFKDVGTSRNHAHELLEHSGVTSIAARSAIEFLDSGPAPGNRVMRGAMLIDCDTGDRLEADASRGVRVSRIGIESSTAKELDALLHEAELEVTRVREAITLAAKVMAGPGVVAELCWSDDPSYVTGYVAAAGLYTRLTPLKTHGSAYGGRAFFVRPETDMSALVNYLEKKPFLVNVLGQAAGGIKLS